MMMLYQIDNINKEIEIIKKKNQLELLELNQYTWNKKFTSRLSSRIELTVEKVSRFEDKPVEILQSKEQRKKKEEKWTEPHKNVGHLSTLMHDGRTRRRGEKERSRKSICSNNGWKVSGFTQQYYSSRKLIEFQITV